MNTMTYKGYLGSVAYSEKDNVFFGKIEGINGLVNFEGESVKELTDAFHEAVDDYLAYCKDEGIEPDKSYSGVLNVRLTPAIHRKIAILARQAGQTINAYIKKTLEEKVETAAAMWHPDDSKGFSTSADTSALESEIDRLVYQFFGLTDEDLSFEGFFDKRETTQLYKLFMAHPELNASAIARRMGISQSLMAQYISGKKKASDERVALILNTVREIGHELIAV